MIVHSFLLESCLIVSLTQEGSARMPGNLFPQHRPKTGPRKDRAKLLWVCDSGFILFIRTRQQVVPTDDGIASIPLLTVNTFDESSIAMETDTKGDNNVKDIARISENDVLLGRGSGPNDHSGNKKYRQLVLQRKEEYIMTKLRSEKNEIAKWVFNQISQGQGRFVKAVEGDSESASHKTLYVEVDYAVALEKIRQSLRQALDRPKSRPKDEKTAGSTNNSEATESGVRSKFTSNRPPTKHLSRPFPPPLYELQRYKLLLSYDGTRYKGWQRQSSSNSLNDGISIDGDKSTAEIRHLKKRKYDERGRVVNIPLTIQESLEDSLEMYSTLDRATLRVRMAGRTDAGVHAKAQVVVVSLPKVDSEFNVNKGDREMWQIRRSINSRLPRDMSIEDVTPCEETFDPRQDVVLKQYSYTMRFRCQTFGPEGKTPIQICSKGGPELLRSAFDDGRCWLVPWALESSKIDEYCKLLSGDHDFSAFVHKSARDERDNCKPVTRFECVRIRTTTCDSDAPVCDVRFEVEAIGFGRSQVRNLVGFIVDLCRGAIEGSDTVEDWLWTRPTQEIAKRVNAAPASGLCLEWVKYSNNHEAPSS